jgi:hypothetical protein
MGNLSRRFDGKPSKVRTDNGGKLFIPSDEADDFRRTLAARGDAGESAFTALALSYVEPFVYETVLPPMKGRLFVEHDTSTPYGAISTRYRMFTRTGIANFDVGGADDFPATSFFVQEFAHNFYNIAASYRYTMKDLAAAAVAATNGGPPINIDLENAIAAREAIERKLDRITAFGSTSAGDPSIGLVGLLNLPNANVYALADGAQGSTLWSTKTPDEIIADITGIIASQAASTFERFIPKKLIIPIEDLFTIAGQSMGDGRSDTVLSYAVRTRKEAGQPITIESWQYCTGSGAAGADRMVAYDPDRRYVRHMISREFFQYPPFIHGSKIDVECEAATAGVISPYPISVSFADGL